MSRAAPAAEPLPSGFAQALIRWQRAHGRSGLPWQGTRDPYVVWLSEIMLQQTQVSAVVPYFHRFLQRFPDVHALAAASEDEVLSLWSGLGYYSRARNLQRCAQLVVQEHAGEFPRSVEGLAKLPGIGQTTAAAIAAFCFGEKVSILDGNVRRVLTRLMAFGGDQSNVAAQRALWNLAQKLVPADPLGDDMTAYTQGLMDLGATVCTRTRPKCLHCPVCEMCEARKSGTQAQFPVKTGRTLKRHESWWLLLVRRQHPSGQAQWWLERRSANGIWAGLYCPPVYGSETALNSTLERSLLDQQLTACEAITHQLTHRELRLQPMLLDLPATSTLSSFQENGRWALASELGDLGLPAPIRPLLAGL
ncbi:MAG: A/G-specific adenine glycosylase [Hydrogenophaga sp.]|jgi:A/G-specific adenine glycosylase|nr:A/G-specific adenine glycosylase [Hydrogenophaga sp.]